MVEDTKIMAEGITRKTVVFASIIAFLAWTLSVYDYIMFGNLLPVIQKYYGWTNVQITMLGTLVAVGTFFIALTVGPITDYFGRVKGLMVTVGGAALSSFLAGLAGFLPARLAFGYLAIVRSLSGYGYSEQAVNTTYLSEIYRPERRGFIYSWIQGGWPIGVLLASAFILVLLPHVQWYYLFMIASFPAVLLLVARYYLPESPRFKHLQEVRQLIKEGKRDKAEELMKIYEIDLEKVQQFTYKQLFGPDIRRHTIFLASAFVLNWVGVQILLVFATLVLTGAKGISLTASLQWLIISNALAYIGYVVHGFIGDAIGRRETIMIAWAIAGISYITMFLVEGFYPVVLSYTVGLFFFIGAYSALFTYMGESFPTRARATGASFVNAMGPIGAIIGSALFTALLASGWDMNSAGLWSGAVPVLLSAFMLLGARRVPPKKVLEEIHI